MYSGKDLTQSNSGNLQIKSPNVHLIKVMEQQGVKYQSVPTSEDKMKSDSAQSPGDAQEGANPPHTGTSDVVKDPKGTGSTTHTEDTNGTGGTKNTKDTTSTPVTPGTSEDQGGATPPDTEVNLGTGRTKVTNDTAGTAGQKLSIFCSKYAVCILVAMVVLVVLLIIAVIFAFSCSSSCGAQAPALSVPPTTPAPRTPTQGPLFALQGIVTTGDNYTADLQNPSSLAYKAFNNRFIAAVMDFYSTNRDYIAYYEDTIVTDIEEDAGRPRVHFEIYFSQLDNDDNAPPDAHSVLRDEIRTNIKLGPFRIIGDFQLTQGPARS